MLDLIIYESLNSSCKPCRRLKQLWKFREDVSHFFSSCNFCNLRTGNGEESTQFSSSGLKSTNNEYLIYLYWPISKQQGTFFITTNITWLVTVTSFKVTGHMTTQWQATTSNTNQLYIVSILTLFPCYIINVGECSQASNYFV